MRNNMWKQILLLLLITVSKVYCQMRNYYTAAVYEHKIVGDPLKDSPVEFMLKNVAVYKIQAIRAHQKNADIIVFPEYGILGQHFRTRDQMLDYLEPIPDPRTISWNPCQEFHENATVLKELSCIAYDYKIFLIANLGEVKACNTTDINCPTDGRYQFNTNVVFDNLGFLIARYRKTHLFFESVFNTPVKPEFIYFYTNFGRFGILTCFDIFYKEPGIILLEKYNVTNVVFPSYWMSEFPLLTANAFQQGWSIGLKITLLAANIRGTIPEETGSGIYNGAKGAVKFVYNPYKNTGMLIVAKVSKVESRKLIRQDYKSNITENKSTSSYSTNPFTFNNEKQINYTFSIIKKNHGLLKACDGDICCYLQYKFKIWSHNELYALGAFSGSYMKNFTYPRYFQVCIVLKCQDLQDTSCGLAVINATSIFDTLKLTGNFSTKYIFPNILTTGGQIEPPHQWYYEKQTIKMRRSFNKPLLVTSLLSRDYKRDPK